MTLHRFHCPGLLAGPNQLPAEESRHAATVLRLRTGDSVELFDGAGTVGNGVVAEVSRGVVTVQLGEVRQWPFDCRHRLTLAVAMSKAHRQGYLVEKCTELGVAAIWPILAARSVTHPGEAAVEKWARRALEAAKQSGRAWIPDIAQVMPFTEAVNRIGEFDVALFADAGSNAVSILHVLDEHSLATKIIAFVGPEGGWTDEERRTARERGMFSISLSPTVLRAETAAVAACAVIAAKGQT